MSTSETINTPNLKSSTDKKVIYITGFGPFEGYAANASQNVVEELISFGLEELLGVQIHTETLNVEYKCVSQVVPIRWKELKPKLVVHIGVSCLARKITLETRAFNNGYEQLDIKACSPCDDVCIPGQPTLLESKIDLRKTKLQLEADPNMEIGYELSHNPGSYLCGFIYYTSLSIDCSRVVFIHVPELRAISSDESVALKSLTSAVAAAIVAIYKNVDHCDQRSEIMQ